MSSRCGCCGGTPAAPRPAGNRPGLEALAYRVGTHASFFGAMRARLSSATYPGLARLTTHDASDPSVALLDAWAVVGDVLTFYQERIANEGYLRTATERRSVLEQASLVGYRPRPGVAASVFLSYSIDQNAGPVTIPAGARVNSVPGPGEQMQAFETSEPLEARWEWNELGVRLAEPQTAQSLLADGLYLAGVSTGLKPGDPLLLGLGAGAELRPMRVKEVVADASRDVTHVVITSWDGGDPALSLLAVTLQRLAREQFGVASGGIAARAQTVLDDLAGVAATGEPAQAGAKVASALPDLADALDDARRHNGTHLVPWLEESVSALTAVGALLPKEATASTSSGMLGATPREPGFGDVLDRLEEPPSLPPRSPRALNRSVQATFAKNADIYPALLTQLQPRLGPVLYTALGNTQATPASGLTVIALRDAAPLFGGNAPRRVSISGGHVQTDEWELEDDEQPTVAHLDRVYPGVLPATPVLVVRPRAPEPEPATPPIVIGLASTAAQAGATSSSLQVTTIASVREEQRSAYGIGGKVTTLELDDDWWDPVHITQETGTDAFDVLRGTTVYCRSEALPLADAPITADVCGDEVELDQLYDGLRSGRWVIVSGERADLPKTRAVRAAELVMLTGVSQRVKTVPASTDEAGEGEAPLAGDALHTFVTFAKPLSYCYRRGTVVLHANVVHATHGETVSEVLGGGDATQAFQTFTLRRPPLTWTSAPTTTGVASSLELRIGDIAWHEADSIAMLGPTSRGFLTHLDDAGSTSVMFGNGVYGARLPTGAANVSATYRSGIGRPGNVLPDQITLLATKPLGVRAVTNPLRSSGGADAEGRDQARRNAPLGVMALDRLVSTQDYADFARTFAGIGKASATRLSDGMLRLVHVTIAGVDDIPIDLTSDLYRNLVEALHRYGEPAVPIRVEVREQLALVMSANIKVLPDHDWEIVEPAVRSRLLAAFGFDQRQLGQDVLASDVLATIQQVRGVDYVDLDFLGTVTEDDVVARLEGTEPAVPAATSRGPKSRLVVQPARVVNGAIRRAQLAYLLPGVQDSMILTEVTA